MELKPNNIQVLSTSVDLLIVPYGIETSATYEDKAGYSLLIVPYGIETRLQCHLERGRRAFNCTLWN